MILDSLRLAWGWLVFLQPAFTAPKVHKSSFGMVKIYCFLKELASCSFSRKRKRKKEGNAEMCAVQWVLGELMVRRSCITV